MKKAFTKVISLVLALLLLSAAIVPVSASVHEKPTLRFREDGSFTILQFTDTQDTHLPSPNMLSLLQRAMDEVKPDLVVFTGDQIKNYDSDFDGGGQNWKSKLTLHHILKPVVRRGIPFVLTFGNHDAWFDDFTREDQLEYVNRYKGCLLVDEAPEVSGCGNCCLQILSGKSDKPAFNLFFMDSNQSVVEADQIAWYIGRSQELQAANDGEIIPAIEFQHIIPHNGQLLEAFAERGDVFASFFGHNHHRSDKIVKNGIDLYYTPTSGFYEFGPDRDRGARVIKIFEDNPRELETYVLTFNDLFEDNPITDLRYAFFTVFEFDNMSAFEIIKKVLTLTGKAAGYFMISTKGKPFEMAVELLDFIGFDTGFYFNG
ncbi:MAG TPA: metallophosphoesterase [Clostridiales bacterium]|nr:metallophosphoesterase [Clostridiales bacterium]HRT82559.1 metallophosphoesterase [Oscillospiraceae bacterium]